MLFQTFPEIDDPEIVFEDQHDNSQLVKGKSDIISKRKRMLVSQAFENSEESDDNGSGISDIIPNKRSCVRDVNADLTQSQEKVDVVVSMNGQIDQLVSTIVRELIPKIEARFISRLEDVKSELIGKMDEMSTSMSKDTDDIKTLCSQINEMSISSTKWIKASATIKPVFFLQTIYI